MRRYCSQVIVIGLWSMASAMADEAPSVEAAIPEPMRSLGKPAMWEFPNGVRLAVSASSELAQQHVNQGLNHLNGGWEFEAGRHFAAALREDPECLLAHWGMVMSLIDPTPETLEARDAAMERLLDLIEAGAGTELERGYAYGLIKYIQEGPAVAANVFRKVAEKFPNEVQAGLLAALFGRGGYDPSGEATPDQETSEKQLRELMEAHPLNPVPVHALLFIRAEAPVTGETLAMARSLVLRWRDYPPYHHLLGHYEWRDGNFPEAVTAFSRAASLYQEWMTEQQAGLADCPEWLKAESYRIVAMLSAGETEAALAAANELAATPLIKERPASAGNRFLLWEVKSLPARILMSRNISGNAAKAAATLPKPEVAAAFRGESLAYWWLDGLRLLLEGRRQLDDKKTDGARELLAALDHHGEAMARTRNIALAGGEISPWSRAFRGIEVLVGELRGDVALAGSEPLRASAFNWFSSAAERQAPASLLMPPAVLSPMAARLGDYHLAAGKPADAVEAYQRALALFANHIDVLTSLQRAYDAAGESAEAAATARKIESLKDGR